jgi:O-antigen/teichoic acid export membrane protein
VKRHANFLGLRLSQYAVIFVSSVIVARALGPADRGQYALALALASNIWIISHLTLEGAAGRLFGRGEATFEQLTRFLSAAVLTIGLIATSVTLAIGLANRDAILGGASSTTVLLASLTVPLLLVNQMASYMLLLAGRLRGYGWAALLAAATQLVAVLAVVAAGDVTPEKATATTLLGTAAMAVGVTAVLVRHAGPRAIMPGASRWLARRMVATGATLHPLAMAFHLSARIDLLLVGSLASARAAGLYSISMTLAESAFLASNTLAQSGIHEQARGSEGEAARYTVSFSRDCGQIASVSALVAIVAAYPFIRIVYGPEWTDAVAPFAILCVASVTTAVQSPIQFLVARIGRPSSLSVLAITTLVVNVGVTIPLIKAFDIVGASLGTLIAYSCFLVGSLYLLKRARPEVRVAEIFGRPRRDDLLVQWAVLARARARQLVAGVRPDS